MKNRPAVTFESWLEYACDEDSLLFQENDSHVFESELPPTGLPCSYKDAAIAVGLSTVLECASGFASSLSSLADDTNVATQRSSFQKR